MNVLSLFDGMACGMISMLEENIKIDNYYAYEIDKYAIQNTQHNFPDIKELGDVFKEDFTKYEGIDWLIGGSPCTYWSIAQKNNRETEASGLGWELFSQYVRALKEAKPKFFIYENNKSMSKAIRDSIREAFGFEEICINSALVSAQNRQRYYWVGKRNADGSYSKVDVQQPEDRGILLKDILETGYGAGETASGKSFAFTANCAKSNGGAYLAHTLEKHVKTMAAEPVCMRYERTEQAKACRKDYEAGLVHHGFHELSELHPRQDGKTNTLSTVLKDNPICEPVGTTKDGKAFTVTATYWKGSNPDHSLEKHTRTQVAEPVNTTVEGKAYGLTAHDGGRCVSNFVNGGGHFPQSGVAEPIRVPDYGNRDKARPVRASYAHKGSGGGSLITEAFPENPNKQVSDYVSEPVRIPPYGNNDKSRPVTFSYAQQGSGQIEKNCFPVSPNKQQYDYVSEPLICAKACEWDEEGNPTKAVSAADGKAYTVYSVSDGKITIKGKTYPIKLVDGFYIIRKLTVNECKRLQTVPDWYEFCVSDSRAYQLLGNGWTCEVIRHLVRACLATEKKTFKVHPVRVKRKKEMLNAN